MLRKRESYIRCKGVMLTITTIINLINIASLIIVGIAMIITGIIMYILIKIVRKYLKGEGSPPQGGLKEEQPQSKAETLRKEQGTLMSIANNIYGQQEISSDIYWGPNRWGNKKRETIEALKNSPGSKGSEGQGLSDAFWDKGYWNDKKRR
jgi:hypothetical protein